MVLVLFIPFLFLGCTQAERDNPEDPKAINYDPSLVKISGSSSEVQSSSSDVPSSSSDDVPSSGSVEPSSSSALPSSSSDDVSSSSSVEPSSSSALPSSSSVTSSSSLYGGLCAGFVYGTEREHYGKMKKQFCDERDGKRYVYVTIGTQTWMAENLNYEASGSKCYSDSSANCDTYGRLYNWATAMNNSASSTAVPSGVRGVCPENWHLPSDAEWDALMTAVGGSSTAGTKLKAKTGWNSGGNGEDDYDFSALPGGLVRPGSIFDKVGGSGYWWSSTEYNSTNAYDRDMGYSSYVNRFNDDKGYLFSVRCLKD